MAQTEYPANEKQLAYIQSLRSTVIGELVRVMGVAPRPETVAIAALAYSLPTTARTSAEASALIEAYKAPRAYGKAHQDWGLSILRKVAEAIGERGERAPVPEVCYNCTVCEPGHAKATIGGHHDPADWLAEILS